MELLLLLLLSSSSPSSSSSSSSSSSERDECPSVKGLINSSGATIYIRPRQHSSNIQVPRLSSFLHSSRPPDETPSRPLGPLWSIVTFLTTLFTTVFTIHTSYSTHNTLVCCLLFPLTSPPHSQFPCFPKERSTDRHTKPAFAINKTKQTKQTSKLFFTPSTYSTDNPSHRYSGCQQQHLLLAPAISPVHELR